VTATTSLSPESETTSIGLSSTGETPATGLVTSAAKPVVLVDNLWVRYGKFQAVKGINIAIPAGEVYGFIGPNGAGKSSTIKVLATLLRGFQGQVEVCGIDVRRHPGRIREIIGYVPDFFGVYEDLTAREYLHFFAAAYRIPGAKRRDLVDSVLELTDLTHKIDFQVDSLSRGMKQRLSLARVLLHEPQLLLLDEPASGLDPRARIEFRELLKALKEMGKTILLSSHILHELAQLCTQIGIIEAGKIVAQGPLEAIYQQIGMMRLVHIQLANPNPAIAAAIRLLPTVQSVEELTDRLAIKLTGESFPLEDLHAALVQQGAKIKMFQAEVMDMETAFMKLTEGITA
jgi:ABC-2 type transport system ATP-binding protein